MSAAHEYTGSREPPMISIRFILTGFAEGPMRYTTMVRQSGANTTGIPVPDDVVAGLGGGRKPAVTVTVNGFTYRSSIATVDGESMIGLSAERRAASGLQGGDEVEVELELDTAPREVDVPPELEAALSADEAARATWEKLSYSNRSWHVLQVTGTTNEDTRQRRIEKSIAALREGRPR
jgi:hypothetical protein